MENPIKIFAETKSSLFDFDNINTIYCIKKDSSMTAPFEYSEYKPIESKNKKYIKFPEKAPRRKM